MIVSALFYVNHLEIKGWREDDNLYLILVEESPCYANGQRHTSMQYQVFVQSRTDGLFSATIVGVPDCAAEGATQEEALHKATATLRARLAKGKLFTIEVDEAPIKEAANPWLETHGSLRDDPTFDDLVTEIAHLRQQCEAEESKS